MKIREDDIFYAFGKYSQWNIGESYVNAIKEFKWTKQVGYYVEYNICISMEDNLDIIKKYNNTKLSNEDFFNRCMINLQFFVRLVNIKDLSSKFIKDNNIKDYHIKLINRTYFDEDDNKIISGDKRPFGNSYMIGDIAEVVDPENNETHDYLENKYGHIYNEVMDLIIKLSKIFPVRFRNLIYCGRGESVKLNSMQKEYYNHNWCPDISEFRDIIIDNIIT